MPVANKSEYDIAISFLSRDEPLALELHSRLSQHLSVFVYSKEQENIAGTNGLESYRKAFLSRAGLVVVLFRDGWGKTPWTRIEETAITERVLSDGWECLFFIMVDRAATPPKWLPKTYIRFNFEDYGLEQAVGAIKARLQELGGTLKPLDVIQQAHLVERRKLYFAERERIFTSVEGVDACRKEVATVFEHVVHHITEISSMTSVKGRVGVDESNCVVTNGRISIKMHWHPSALNSLENSPLRVKEFNSVILLPNERGVYLSKPIELSEHRYLPEFSIDRRWCWIKDMKPDEYLSSSEVADLCVSKFLHLVDLQMSGKLKPTDFFDDDD